jgi:putative hemolysin
MILQVVFSIALLGCLCLFALLEVALAGLSRVSLRILLDRESNHKISLLEGLAQDRTGFLLPIQFAIQGLMAVSAILVTRTLLISGLSNSILWPIAIMILMIVIVRQLIPNWLAQNRPEIFVLVLFPLMRVPYRLVAFLISPILWLLCKKKERFVAEGRNGGKRDEVSEEEIRAYLYVGEKEGIFGEQESELIQSALEFKATLVREIMTPRSKIVSIAQSATVAELAVLMGSSKHSRIPVYRDNQDSVVGVVYMRTLLSHLSDGKGAESITPLVTNIWFVPETKKIRDLLKEMQRESQPFAIVVSEFGAVSGVVSIEDLVEEIVGEIYDEDEFRDTGLVDEGRGTFKVAGWRELADVEEALDHDLSYSSATTFSGLVVRHLGRVPQAGQKIKLNGLAVKILASDKKRINLMRVWSVSDEGATEKKEIS